MDTTAESFQTSPYQEALWLDQPEGPVAATQAVLELTGAADAGAVQDALNRLVERHEILRTTFTHQPGIRVPLQSVHQGAAVALSERAEDLATVQAQELAAPFDLIDGPLVRVVRTAPSSDRSALVVTASALVLDAGSMAVLAGELASLLNGANGLVEEPLQYADYAAWQRELAAGEEPERHSAASFWTEAARIVAPVVPFASPDSPRGIVSTRAVPIDAELAGTLRAAASRYAATPPALVMAAWQTLLGRLTGAESVTVAMIAAERRHADLDGALGAFSRPVPVTARIAEATFAEVLQEVERGRERALVWQDYAPLEPIAAGDVAFVGHEPAAAQAGTGTLTLREVVATGPRLWVACADDGAQLQVQLGSDVEYLAAEHADRLARELGQLLRSIGADPAGVVAELGLVDGEERQLLLEDWGTGPQLGEAPLVVARFEAAAAAAPDHPAVIDTAGALSYGELDQAANRLAHRLRAVGVDVGGAVGLCTDSSRDAIVGLLGILKAGAAYVPLHHEHPPARLGHQLATAGASVVVSQEALLGHLPGDAAEVICLDRDAEALAALPSTAPEGAATADALAYVIYTSGSTGVPKGVAVTHANLAAYATAITQRLELDATPLSFGLVTSIATDLGNTSLYGALCTGGTLVIIGGTDAADPGAFARVLASSPVDILKITPSHIAALLSGGDAGVLPRRWLVIGGERAPWDLIERVRGLAPQLRILNHYGPTEATIGCLTFDATDATPSFGAATVPVGTPLAGDAVYVVDQLGAPVPVGAQGRLWVAGAGVASGYVGSPELTAERFLPDPFVSGGRVYDTGDVVRWLPDGTLEFMGRVDEQVKIRGYRVEPAEVETALRAHAGVSDAVVVAQASAAGDARLVAYVAADGAPSSDALHAHLAEHVPDFMIPSAIVVLVSLPRTPSGKVDRLALPDPADVAAPASEYIAPRTPMEVAVATIWNKVLGLDQVGVNDDFFSLGGHSLLATQVVAQVRSDFAVDLPLHSLFSYPTVESLTEEIVRMMGDAGGDETAKLLAELEGLSDEDAERLLAGDEPSQP